ncbi:unnamed protein product [Calypogeia fissa]
MAESDDEMPYCDYYGDGFPDDADEEYDLDEGREISGDQWELVQPIADQETIGTMKKKRKLRQTIGTTPYPVMTQSSRQNHNSGGGVPYSIGAEYGRRVSHGQFEDERHSMPRYVGAEYGWTVSHGQFEDERHGMHPYVGAEYGGRVSFGRFGGECPGVYRSVGAEYGGCVSHGQFGDEHPHWSGVVPRNYGYHGTPFHRGATPIWGNYDEQTYHNFHGGRFSREGLNAKPVPRAGSVAPCHSTNSTKRERPKVDVDSKGWVDLNGANKNKWLADFKRELLQWMDISCVSWASRNQTDWQAVCKFIVDNWVYIGKDGKEGVDIACLEWHGAKIIKNERWRLHRLWTNGGGRKTTLPPMTVRPQVWERLVEYFLSPKTQEKSKKMSLARAAIKNPSVVGRKGHAPIIEKLRNLKGGESPTKEEVRAEAQKQRKTKGKEASQGSAYSTFTDVCERLKSVELHLERLTKLVEEKSERILQAVRGLKVKNEEQSELILQAIRGLKVKNDEKVGGVVSVSAGPDALTGSMRAGQSKSNQNTARDIPIPTKSCETPRHSLGKVVGITAGDHMFDDAVELYGCP